jgi:hypothetical protein
VSPYNSATLRRIKWPFDFDATLMAKKKTTAAILKNEKNKIKSFFFKS